MSMRKPIYNTSWGRRPFPDDKEDIVSLYSELMRDYKAFVSEAADGEDIFLKALAEQEAEKQQLAEERDSFKLANDNLLDDNYSLQAQLDMTERARTDGKTIIDKLVNKGRATSNTIAHYKARIQEQDAEYIALAKENEQNIIKIASLEVQVLSAEKMVEWVQRNEADNCETIDQLYKENRKLKKVLRAIKEMAKC